MQSLGNHLIVEMYDCNHEFLNNTEAVEQALIDAANCAGATVVQSVIHHFNPYGVSGVVVIEESHLTVHTWPEYGYAALDIFTCGEVDYYSALRLLKSLFGTENVSVSEMRRGVLGMGVNPPPGVELDSSSLGVPHELV